WGGVTYVPFPPSQGKQFTFSELCAILRGTGQPLKERLIAAPLLSGSQSASNEAVQCLLHIYRQRAELRELRIASVLSLTNLGFPAFVALREVVESEDASGIEVRMPGETTLLSVIPAQSLLFTPGGHGILQQIVGNPRSPFGWAVAFTVLHAFGDPGRCLVCE
ncbi:MAG: hypothetical protein ABI833_13475, partial [Acidobacteriota bacterium]